MTENAIAKEIVDAAFRIHTTLGPGLLQSVYDMVLAYELGRQSLRTVRQQTIPLVYENVRIEGYRTDRLSENEVQQLLNFDYFEQVDAFFKEHRVCLNY